MQEMVVEYHMNGLTPGPRQGRLLRNEAPRVFGAVSRPKTGRLNPVPKTSLAELWQGYGPTQHQAPKPSPLTKTTVIPFA